MLLHPRRRLLNVLTMSGVAKCTFCRCGSCRVDVCADCLSCENVGSARFVSSSEEVTILANTLDVRLALEDLLADGTKQTEGCHQLCEPL